AETPFGVTDKFGHGGFYGGCAVFAAQLAHTFCAHRIRGELGVEIADGLSRNPDIRGNQTLQRATAFPVARVAEAGGREDQAFGVHVDGFGGQAGVAAAKVQVVGNGAGETDQFSFKEDRRIDEDVLQVLAARVRVIGDVEVAFFQ